MTTEPGYDPSDLKSFPYQQQDPPFDENSLTFEDAVLERAPDLDILEMLRLLVPHNSNGWSEFRTLDMALRLFLKMNPTACDDFLEIPLPDLFAACLDQALTWERG